MHGLHCKMDSAKMNNPAKNRISLYVTDSNQIMVEQKPFFEETTDTGHARCSELILYNDDFNTFEYVINSLIEVCGHDPDQAEQAALIAHLKGKCGVKTGDKDYLKPMCNELNHRNLTAKIS